MLTRSISFTAGTLLIAASTAFAAPASPPATTETAAPAASSSTQPANSATVYREAFALLDTLNEDDRGRLGMCGKEGCWVINTPLDAAAADLLERQKKTIDLARKAAVMGSPRWDFGGDAQKMVDLANRAPRLSGLLVLQARTALRDGKTQEAIDDLFLALTLSRHAAAETTLVAKLTEIAAWRPAADLLVQQLPTLPKDIVAKLGARLEQLPPSPTMDQLVQGEHVFAKQSSRKQGLGATVMLGSMKGFYDAMGQAGPLSPEAYGKKIDEEMAKYPINPWVKIIAPSLKRSREGIAVLEVKNEMLKTAIDVTLNGEAAVKASKDPFGDGPFGYHKRPAGFVLQSELQYRDKPVEWTIGS